MVVHLQQISDQRSRAAHCAYDRCVMLFLLQLDSLLTVISVPDHSRLHDGFGEIIDLTVGIAALLPTGMPQPFHDGGKH